MESTLSHIPDLPPDKDFHLFVCYIRENLHDVHTIVANLERAGLQCCYHERDFTPGSSILDNMMYTISRSLHMLVVLSEDFVNSPYAVHELNEALHIRISEGYSIIPIKIEPCQVPDAMKHITWIDAENDDVNDMHHKILDALLKTANNGQSLLFKLMPFAGCLSFTRYGLLSTQNLDTLEELVTKSAFVRYRHVFKRFKFITFIVYILMSLLSMFVGSIFTTVAAARGTQHSSDHSTDAFLGCAFWILMTSIVPLACCCADCLSCFQLMKGLRIK
ncbi:TLR1-like protein, partial [Mya arenaria]